MTYEASVVEVLEDGTVNLHEDDLVRDAAGESGLLGLSARFNRDESLALDSVLLGGLLSEGETFSAGGVHEKELGAANEVIESRPKQ